MSSASQRSELQPHLKEPDVCRVPYATARYPFVRGPHLVMFPSDPWFYLCAYRAPPLLASLRVLTPSLLEASGILPSPGSLPSPLLPPLI